MYHMSSLFALLLVLVVEGTCKKTKKWPISQNESVDLPEQKENESADRDRPSQGGRLTNLATSHPGWLPRRHRRPCSWAAGRQRRPDTAAEIQRPDRSPGRRSWRRRSRSKATPVNHRAWSTAVAAALPTMIYSQLLLLLDVKHLFRPPTIISIYAHKYRYGRRMN
jgi:hypothetical protein